MKPQRVPGTAMIMKCNLFVLVVLCVIVLAAGNAWAQGLPGLRLEVTRSETPEDFTITVQIILLITFLTLAPAILILVTSFTRIVIILSLLRHALSIQQIPPNQVIIGLSLFLTFFIMTPVFNEINEQAVQPYIREEITQREAFDRAVVPLRTFMFAHT